MSNNSCRYDFLLFYTFSNHESTTSVVILCTPIRAFIYNSVVIPVLRNSDNFIVIIQGNWRNRNVPHKQEIENDNGKVVYFANNNERVVDFKGKKELFSSPEPVKITGKVGD